MNIYTISDDVYFQNGIISLAKSKGWDIVAHELDSSLTNQLTPDDVVILHLDAKNSSYAKAISPLNKVCKLLVILGAARDIVINDADLVIKSRDSLLDISRAIRVVVKKKKEVSIRDSELSDIENTILKESLKGKNIHLIAKTLNIPPKRVYAYRNKACKKLGGKKISDLLLIKDKLLEESSTFFTSPASIRELDYSF
ncbi:helix-turn-helix transcriptional regulator [Kosakonia sacchari]|uniref:Two-component response regulator, FixJ family, consists of REC and HTH domains n=1 Tax=Kosakonia sacchari TaxID=1158459 RepID=A0A1G4XEU3_9ENTR|nr:LuxR C-terminal-related transcriptional regulator [Kosakonia sacchari]MDN2484590.1 LuxR C-terminal-related transcriptional regulator [Kosakonia sacchari]SCX39534.1 Two-component response regulator, FixJ family, consists of REC and HTH domains [Kosakonia sacchari]